MNDLTDKQRLFALAYTGEAKFNATKAARIARYEGDEHTLRSVGYENLTKPDIIQYIKELTEQVLKDLGYQSDRVIRELVDVAFADLAEFENENGQIEIDRSKQPTAALKKIKRRTVYKDDDQYVDIEVELHDKKWALEMLSKLLDMKSGKEYHEIDLISIIKEANEK